MQHLATTLCNFTNFSIHEVNYHANFILAHDFCEVIFDEDKTHVNYESRATSIKI